TIDADTNWTFELAQAAGGETHFTSIASGRIDGMDVSAGGYNDIRIIFSGANAFFYANGRYIATLDPSSKMDPGDVTIATGLNDGREINGESTRFERFTVWSLDADQTALARAKQQGRLVARDDFTNNVNNWFVGESSDGNAYRSIQDGVMAVTLRKENWVF